MVTEITSKSELMALAAKLETEVQNLKNAIESMNATLSGVTNYDGIDAASAASTLSTNLLSIATDAEVASKNITNYVTELNNFDVDDLAIETEEETTPSETETETTVLPTGTSEGTISNGTSSNSTGNSTSTGGGVAGIAAGLVSGLTGGTSSSTGSNSSSSNNYGSSVTTTGTVSTSGKTSSNGRTQRSALTDIVITDGDPNIDVSRYNNNLANGFEVTTGNLAYELCDEDIDLLCAIVSAESDKTYDDALAVITTILNRCEKSNWIASHGRDPISQATAPNQFVVYQHGSYENYLNGNAPSTVVKAVKDALAGVRNHEYCNFRSNNSTSYSNNMITSTGNRYGNS